MALQEHFHNFQVILTIYLTQLDFNATPKEFFNEFAWDYFKYALIFMILTLVIASIWFYIEAKVLKKETSSPAALCLILMIVVIPLGVMGTNYTEERNFYVNNYRELPATKEDFEKKYAIAVELLRKEENTTNIQIAKIHNSQKVDSSVCFISLHTKEQCYANEVLVNDSTEAFILSKVALSGTENISGIPLEASLINQLLKLNNQPKIDFKNFPVYLEKGIM